MLFAFIRGFFTAFINLITTWGKVGKSYAVSNTVRMSKRATMVSPKRAKVVQVFARRRRLWRAMRHRRWAPPEAIP
jgi:hypothetical protein